MIPHLDVGPTLNLHAPGKQVITREDSYQIVIHDSNTAQLLACVEV